MLIISARLSIRIDLLKIPGLADLTDECQAETNHCKHIVKLFVLFSLGETQDYLSFYEWHENIEILDNTKQNQII